MQTLYVGKPFVYPPNNSIGRRLARGWEWDWFLRIVLPALVKEKEPTLCEVGSNIGASLRQILAAKPGARVLAFEPSDHFRPYLLNNIRFAEASHQVRVHPYLVGREVGSKKLHYGNNTGTAVEAPSYGHHFWAEQVVEMVTLDAVVAGERVHFIKVDTDGFEFEVLRGAVNILKDSKPSLHFEFATFLIPEPIQSLAWLQGLGYKRLLCLTQRGDPIGVTEDPSEAVKWSHDNGYCDIVTCPEGSEAEARLLSRKLLLSLKLQGKIHWLKRKRGDYYSHLKWKSTRYERRATRLGRKATRLGRKATRLGRKAIRLRRKATYHLITKVRGASRLW